MLRYEWHPGNEITDVNDYQHDFNTSPNHAAVILPDPVLDAELEMRQKDSHSDIECEMQGQTPEEEMIVTQGAHDEMMITQGAQNETLATQGAQDEIQNEDQGAFMETNVENSRNLNQENNENLGPQTNIDEVVDDQANVNETLTEGEDTVEPSDDI